MSSSSLLNGVDEEQLTLLNKRNLKNQSSYEGESESSFKSAIDKHSRDIRTGLISSLLLIWACLMLPYDIYGSIIHRDTVWDIDMFVSSLVMWLIAHICVIVSSLLSLINLKYLKHIHWIPNAQLLLIMIATFLQIIGAVLFSYSYCVNLTDSDTSTLWGSCVCKSHGLFILYNAGFITYLGFIIFAERFHGALPIFAFNVCNKYQEKPQSFTRNFRIAYLSCISFIGMILILVYGFDIYPTVDASYQAIFIGDTFILFGTFVVILTQIIFHSHCVCTNKQQISDYSISDANIAITNHANAQKKKKKRRKNCEYVLHLFVYFVMFSGILLTFMYSVASKISEASLVAERLRLVGNMLIISGTALVICFEIYSKKDGYDDDDKKHIDDHQYEDINDEFKM